MRGVFSIVLLSVILGGTPGYTQDWPRYRGANSDGRLEAFYIKPDGILRHNWQLRVSGLSTL